MTPADAARAAKILPPENWPSDVWANRRKALEREFEEVRIESMLAAYRSLYAKITHGEIDPSVDAILRDIEFECEILCK